MVELTAAEAAVYDRQLRVWGVETQKRLNNAKILIAGCSGVAAEVAKNIVLAGVGQLSLMDDTPCSQGAPGNFLVPSPPPEKTSIAEASATTLREMNPLVEVKVYAGNILTLRDHSFVRNFNLLLLVGASLWTMLQYDKKCADHGVAFYAVISRGPACYFFANLHTHSFRPATEGSQQAQSAVETQLAKFASMREAVFHSWAGLNLRKTSKLFFVIQACALFERKEQRFPGPSDTDEVRKLSQEHAATSGISADSAAAQLPERLLADFLASDDEIPAVNAVIGGILANEALKAVSRHGAPINNIFLFSLHDGVGEVETLQ